MKKTLLLTALLAVLLCTFAGASAEGEMQLCTAEGELFQTGGLPAVSLGPQTYSLCGPSLYEYIIEQLEAREEEIVIISYGATEEEMYDAFVEVINARPDLFYVDNSWSYYLDGGVVYSILPQYKYSGAELEERIAAFNAKLNEIVAYASGASTTLGKLMRVNDYFCVNFCYDESLSKFAADELFIEGTGVCQAYMLGYRAVLDKLGITSTTATSKSMKHTWNIVYLDGAWYHIDVTWNDPTADTPYRARHYYFLVSDSAMNASRGHYNWVAPVSAGSTKYDSYFWVGKNSPIPVIGDAMYYVSGEDECTIYGWTASAGSNVIHSFNSSGDSGWLIPDGNHPLGATKTRLYYATADAVYSIPIDGGTPVKEYATGEPDDPIISGWLNGTTMYLYNGSVHSFAIGQTPVISLDSTLIELTEGETVQLTAEIDPEGVEIAWSAGDAAVAAVDENGRITGVVPGVASVTATAGDVEAECTVIVHSRDQIIVPDTVVEIKEGAFTNSGAIDVVLPEGLQTIEKNAFKDCKDLKIVLLPENIQSFDRTAFDGCDDVVLLVKQGSRAHEFAAGTGKNYIVIP